MNDGDDMRCTDEKLFQLCQDFNGHVEAHDRFVERFERHEEKENGKFDLIIEAQHSNTVAIGELTKQVSVLVKDTRDIVQLHKDFQGAARIGSSIQHIAVQLLKWGGIFGGIGAGILYAIENFGEH